MTTTRVLTLPKWPTRAADSNKGTYGRILIVAGSTGMSGAAVLCGSAALRGGAGLVRVATPHAVGPLVAVGNPCYMTLPLAQDAGGQFTPAALAELLDRARESDVVAVGPGLGRGLGMPSLVSALVTAIAVPMVLDADGLNACVGRMEVLEQRKGALIITPHPGEFGRLLGIPTAQVQAARETLAVEFAQKTGTVVLLKGHATIVTDGSSVFVNETGNPGMATAGSGDVLTGLIAALLGQGLAPFAAAQLGANIHGLAGDLAVADLGEEGLIATDLVAYLPKAILRIPRQSRR